MDVVGHAPDRQPVQRPLPGLLVEQHVPSEGVGIEEIREEPDGVAEVDELIVEDPFRDIARNAYPERDVGRSASLQRQLELFWELRLLIENELDLLAAPLLESGDGLRDRRVLLGMVSLLPPHHEVGGLRGDRRQDECRSKENGSGAHARSSLKSQVDRNGHPAARQRKLWIACPRKSASGSRAAVRAVTCALPVCYPKADYRPECRAKVLTPTAHRRGERPSLDNAAAGVVGDGCAPRV